MSNDIPTAQNKTFQYDTETAHQKFCKPTLQKENITSTPTETQKHNY